MNNLVIGKTMESIRKHQGIKHSTTKKEKTTWYPNQIMTEQSFSQKILTAVEMKKTQIFIRKFVYLGFTIL